MTRQSSAMYTFYIFFHTFFYLQQLMLFLVAFTRTNTGAFAGLIESLI